MKRNSSPIYLLFLLAMFCPNLSAMNDVNSSTQTASPLAKMSLEELMNVEVTSVSRQESTVGQSPAAIFVITQEMIRRSGAAVIPELFRMVPGMEVVRIDGNKWAVGVRGFNERFGRFLLVQIDGRALYNPIFSGVYWDTVDYPLEDIERIEVIRGPGASVWGANAVNGVINIITKSAKDTHGGFVTGGGGSEEHGFGTLRYGGSLKDKLHYRAYGKGFNRDKQFGGDIDPYDAWWGSRGGARVDWQVKEQDALTFQGDYMHGDSGRHDTRPVITAPFTFDNRESEVTNGGNLLGRWTHTKDQDSNWQLRMYWDRFHRNAGNDTGRVRWDTYDVDFQHQFPLGGWNKMIWGWDYRVVDAHLGKSKRDDGFILSWVPEESNPQLFSAFLQDEIALAPDKLSLTLGSKIEYNDFTGFEVQPTARLLWTPTKRQSVWTAVSRAVRTPSLSDDAGRSTTLQSTVGVGAFPQSINNPDFKSEELLAYELGYRVQATHRFSLDTALFYNAYDRLRSSLSGTTFTDSQGALISPSMRTNLLNGGTYGVELAPTWKIRDGWRLTSAYTFLQMILHRNDADLTLAQKASLAGQEASIEKQNPEHQVYLQSSWDLPHHVEFDLTGRYVERLPGFVPIIPSYISMDLRLGWRPLKNLGLEVVGQNLLDSHHSESGTSSAIRSPIIEIQRSVYGKVTLEF